MGAKQSRVVTPETAAELRPEDDYEAETRTSIRLTSALIEQINGTHGAANKAKQAVSGLTPQYGTAYDFARPVLYCISAVLIIHATMCMLDSRSL